MSNKVEAVIQGSHIKDGVLHLVVTWKEKGSDRVIRTKPYELAATDVSAAKEVKKRIKAKCRTYEGMVEAVGDQPHLTGLRKGDKMEQDTVLEE